MDDVDKFYRFNRYDSHFNLSFFINACADNFALFIFSDKYHYCTHFDEGTTIPFPQLNRHYGQYLDDNHE